MANSATHPPAWWPTLYYMKMEELLAAPERKIVIAISHQKPALNSRMQRWSAFRRSLYLYPGWPAHWSAPLREYDIHLARESREGMHWELTARLKPAIAGFEQIIDETVKTCASGVDSPS